MELSTLPLLFLAILLCKLWLHDVPYGRYEATASAETKPHIIPLKQYPGDWQNRQRLNTIGRALTGKK